MQTTCIGFFIFVTKLFFDTYQKEKAPINNIRAFSFMLCLMSYLILGLPFPIVEPSAGFD